MTARHFRGNPNATHRRAEAAITAKEMKSYASESARIVAGSDRGYRNLVRVVFPPRYATSCRMYLPL